MAEEMVTLGGVVLSRSQYLRVARRWEAALASDGSPAAVLAGLHDWMSAFEAALPEGAERATDAAVQAASAAADAAAQAEPLAPRRSPSSQARWLFAYLLGSLCHPSRLRRSHRIGARPSWLEALRSLGNKLAWLLGRGTVDMLFVPRPFKLQRVPTVARFLSSEEGSLVRDYLRRVVQRRGLFAWGTRPMMDVVLDLSLATTVISRFARCRAAAEAREKVTPEDVREGISVAEMLILNHASVGDEGGVMARVRWHMLANRASFREMLATEA
jgi:lysine-N-methylase